MTRTEAIEFSKQLTREDHIKHNIPMLYDISHEKCIHEKEFDYYPEIHAIVIGDAIVRWNPDADWVSPYNPEHITLLKERAKRQFGHNNSHVMIVAKNSNGTIYDQYVNENDEHIKRWLSKHNLKTTIIDNTKVYYTSEIDMENNNYDKYIITCQLLATKHRTTGLDPEKNTPPEEWIALDDWS